MGWKLRKDKLRADQAEDAQTTPDIDGLASAAAPEAAETGAAPVASEHAPTGDAGVFTSDVATHTADTESSHEPLLLDTPELLPLPGEFAGHVRSEPEHAPLSFDDATAPSDAGAVDETAPPAMPPFHPVSHSEPAEAEGEEADEIPVFAPEITQVDAQIEALSLAPNPDAPRFDPAPDPLSAFAPYQPPDHSSEATTEIVPAEDEELGFGLAPEVGTMPFDPQSPVMVLPDTGEAPPPADATEPAPRVEIGGEAEAAPPVFEPAFEQPETPDAAPEPTFDAPSFMDRDALAAGLVSTASETGLPRVAPFVLETPVDDVADYESGPHLLVVRLGSLSATYPLSKPIMTIGRPDSETQNYPDVEVELDDGISRRHAEVRQQDDGFYLVDVGSTNGTILNGEMLVPGQPARLMRGDHIRLGERTEIVFE